MVVHNSNNAYRPAVFHGTCMDLRLQTGTYRHETAGGGYTVPVAYAYLKYMIDYTDNYSKDQFFDDLQHYIFNPVMLQRIKLMVERNYKLNLKGRKSKKITLKIKGKAGADLYNLGGYSTTADPDWND